MNKITKLVFFFFLFVIAISRLFNGELMLSIALIGLLAFSVPFFDFRENKRQFYRGMRKLYICVDLQGFIASRESLLRNALFKKTVFVPFELLNAIESYYMGNIEQAREQLRETHAKGDYLFWRNAYLTMIEIRLSSQTTREQITVDLDLLVKKVPRHFNALAIERLELLHLISKGATIDKLELLRERFSSNLLVAESTQLIAELHQDQRLKEYYFKAALNIGKGLILSKNITV